MRPTTAPWTSMLDLEAEALLDPTITYDALPSTGAPTTGPQGVFLTGATGFVGAFLLEELLRTTGADVFCLIRADHHDAARLRLADHLQSYELWREEYADRIHPVVGDLTQPRLGLSEEAFDSLAGQIDVIYHSAGSTNALYPYGRLKATNVTGTEEILRLASIGTTKSVQYLSTLALLFTGAHVGVDSLNEDTIPALDPTLKGGYAQSKWVAERMVRSAQERGLPASIYRCVRVTGHSQTGKMNEMHDILPLVLKACVQMGSCPALDVDVTLAPVDYISRAIVHLSRQEGSPGQAFHLLTPRAMPWQELMATVRSFGYGLEELSYPAWRQEVRLRASQSDDKPFYLGLLMVLQAQHYLLYPRPPMDTSHTQAGLAGTDIVCPPAEPSLMGKYIAHWQRVGYFPPPPVDPVDHPEPVSAAP